MQENFDNKFEEETQQSNNDVKAEYKNEEQNKYEAPKRKKCGLRPYHIVLCAIIFAFGYIIGVCVSSAFCPPPDTNETSEQTTKIVVPEKQIAVSIESNVSEIVDKLMPAMVSINTKYTYVQDTFFFGRQTIESSGAGSGIIIDKNEDEIVVLTNAHVVDDAEEITICFVDGSNVPAVIKGCDAEADVALVSINKKDVSDDTLNKISCATIGDSDNLKLGEPVIAIGNSLGYGQTVTFGVISALNRTGVGEDGYTRTLIQTDAAINPGNSGGALVNMNGEVVGINESKIVSEMVDGVNFAIPITTAKSTISQLEQLATRQIVDESERGSLGVKLSTVSQDAASYYGIPQGAYVSDFFENSSAEASGLKKGDVITHISGVTVTSAEKVIEELAYYRVGDTIEVTFMRLIDGTYQSNKINITLGA